MARKDTDLYNIDTLPKNIRQAVLDLRQDFDSHNHDGANSARIHTLSVDTISAQVFSIRKTSFSSSVSGIWIGVDTDGYVKMNIGDSSRYLKYNGATGAVSMNGDITAGTINLGGGNFTVDNSGNMVAKSVAIGGSTRQYTISDGGMFSFGDGSDGSATLDGSNTYAWASKSGSTYTLLRDVNLTSLTINSGSILNTAGYRIFGQDTLTIAGTIRRNGNDGAAGTNDGVVAAGGTALADGYLKGAVKGGDGGFLVPGVGSTQAEDGTAVTNALGSAGQNGGAGGAGGGSSSVDDGGSGGGATTSNVALAANWHLVTLLDVTSTGATLKFTNSGGAGGGGFGSQGVGNGSVTAGGGGGATNGGIIAIYFRNIVISSGGVISANGGNGGDGANGPAGGGNGGTGGGGGGGGGNGGIIILVYNSYSNAGSVTVTAGTGGTGGTGGSGTPSGTAGSDGDDGVDGVVYQFAIAI